MRIVSGRRGKGRKKKKTRRQQLKRWVKQLKLVRATTYLVLFFCCGGSWGNDHNLASSWSTPLQRQVTRSKKFCANHKLELQQLLAGISSMYLYTAATSPSSGSHGGWHMTMM
jgi:hypothetical protein